MPAGGLIGQENAARIDVEVEIPILVGEIDRRAHGRDAGIGGEDIETAKRSNGGGKGGLDGCAAAHVDLGGVAVVRQARCRRRCALGVEVEDGDAGAERIEGAGNRRADAGGPAGHDGGLAGEVEGCWHASILFAAGQPAGPVSGQPAGHAC